MYLTIWKHWWKNINNKGKRYVFHVCLCLLCIALILSPGPVAVKCFACQAPRSFPIYAIYRTLEIVLLLLLCSFIFVLIVWYDIDTSWHQGYTVVPILELQYSAVKVYFHACMHCAFVRVYLTIICWKRPHTLRSGYYTLGVTNYCAWP